MKSSKPLLLAVAFICLALLGVALYLQHVMKMAPCPLCVLQRYAFAGMALVCLVFALLPRASARKGAGIAMVAALLGAAVACWHLYIKAHPEVSCGIDPMETALNQIPSANLMPFLFKADGFCTTEYAPIFGLSIPQWALAWFVIMLLLLGRIAFKRRN
ncbi:MAG: disulfide bond formation protein B [Janthinobacterium lividum]